jgi:hypothetical protein
MQRKVYTTLSAALVLVWVLWKSCIAFSLLPSLCVTFLVCSTAFLFASLLSAKVFWSFPWKFGSFEFTSGTALAYDPDHLQSCVHTRAASLTMRHNAHGDSSQPSSQSWIYCLP